MTAAIVDSGRRDFLLKATTAMTVSAIAASTVPFLASWKPTAATRLSGLPVSIDLSKIEEGAGVKLLWRGTPMWVVRRSSEIVAGLNRHRVALKDPDSLNSEQPLYARNELRSRRADVMVLTAICTHLGCLPEFKRSGDAELGNDVEGGFFCACHGSRYDAAGRVLNGSPAPSNLPVPEYYFRDEGTLIVGASQP